MVSEFAMSEIRANERNGIIFTHEEVIRLNALGLAVDHGADSAENYALPRVAFLAGMTFREPTIGHETWLDRIREIVDFSDVQTLIVTHAYALTRDSDALPPADAKFMIGLCCNWFSMSKLRKVTFRQLISVLEYVRYGCLETSGEFPAETDRKEKAKACRELRSVAIGVMRDAVAAGIGLSLADIRSLTVEEASGIVNRALMAKTGFMTAETQNAKANADFYRTLDTIIKGKENK